MGFIIYGSFFLAFALSVITPGASAYPEMHYPRDAAPRTHDLNLRNCCDDPLQPLFSPQACEYLEPSENPQWYACYSDGGYTWSQDDVNLVQCIITKYATGTSCVSVSQVANENKCSVGNTQIQRVSFGIPGHVTSKLTQGNMASLQAAAANLLNRKVAISATQNHGTQDGNVVLGDWNDIIKAVVGFDGGDDCS